MKPLTNTKRACVGFAVFLFTIGLNDLGPNHMVSGLSASTQDARCKFTVKPGEWNKTGIHIEQGQRFRVKADVLRDENGKVISGVFKYKEHPFTEFGPNGNYWGWFSLKAKVGDQIEAVGGNGEVIAGEDGVLELGAPSKTKLGEGEEAGLDRAYGFCVTTVEVLPGAKDTTRCEKRLRVRGFASDGQIKERFIIVTKRYNKFSQDQLEAQKAKEKAKYAEYTYTQIGEPTKNQDCAGFVMGKLWGGRQFFVEAPNFVNNVVKEFGEQISDNLTYGDVRPGDIVVYGGGGHVALVVGTPTFFGKTFVQIETKDREESVFFTVLASSLSNDPLVQNYGAPSIWRINTSKVKVYEAEPSECPER